MFITTELAAIGKRVTVVDYPDGRLSIRYTRRRARLSELRPNPSRPRSDCRQQAAGRGVAMIRDQQLSREPQHRSQRAPRRRDQRDARLFKVG